jgi:hypothetical protein
MSGEIKMASSVAKREDEAPRRAMRVDDGRSFLQKLRDEQKEKQEDEEEETEKMQVEEEDVEPEKEKPKENRPSPPPAAAAQSSDFEMVPTPGARFTNFQELFLTRILNAILKRLRINS